MDDLLLITGNGLALVIAWALARLWLPSKSTLDRLLVVVGGLPIVVIPLLTLLGVAGRLDVGTTLGALAVLAVAAVGLLIAKPPRAEGPAAEGPAAEGNQPEQGAGQAEQPAEHPIQVIYAVAAIALVVAGPGIERLLIDGWTPQWDDLTYHGSMAAHWLQARALVLGPANYHAYYPGNGELFAAWFMLPSKLDAFASLAGFYWLVLSALAVASIARSLGASRAGAWLSAAIVLASRPFAHQASSFAAVDLACAALAAAAIAIALGATRTESPSRTLARVAYLGCLAGLATGSKITFAPLGMLALVWVGLQARPRIGRALALCSVFAITAVCCGSYWYIRNYLLTGNPVFPAQLLFLDGPLNAAERLPTTLLYQLQHVEGAELKRAWRSLLDWPRGIALATVAGYVIGLVLILLRLLLRRGRLSAERKALTERAALVWLSGMLILAITVTGPFSGTANGPYADLQVRLRFFLGFVLFGAPVFVYAIEQTAFSRRVAIFLAAPAIALMSQAPVLAIVLSVAIAVFAAPALHQQLRALLPKLRSAHHAGVIAACFLVPAPLVVMTSQLKEPAQEAAARKEGTAWQGIKRLPDGARLTWFFTFDRAKYYRAFGKGLRVTPVPVEEDGLPFVYLHEVWRALRLNPAPADPHAWRPQDKRPLRWEFPGKRQYRMEDLVKNLTRQRIAYVFLVKRHKGEWGPQIQVLDKSKEVKRLEKKSNFALYVIKRLARPKGDR